MAGQERVNQSHDDAAPENEPAPPAAPAAQSRDAEVDALLDEIDDVLGRRTPSPSSAASSRRAASDLPMSADAPGGLPASFMRPGSSSFVDFLADHAPHLLPGARPGGVPQDVGVPHATTIVALRFSMAGSSWRGTAVPPRARTSRAATSRRSSPRTTCPLSASPGRRVSPSSLSGCSARARALREDRGHPLVARRQGEPARDHDPRQPGSRDAGLVVVPLFAGYDADRGTGRIFSYDVTGGRYEEQDFHAVGSGAMLARGSLKKEWRRGLGRDAAVRAAVGALFDAADDDSATGGPDSLRDIWPVVAVVTAAAMSASSTRKPRDGDVRDRRGPPLPTDGGAAMTMPFYVSPEQTS